MKVKYLSAVVIGGIIGVVATAVWDIWAAAFTVGIVIIVDVVAYRQGMDSMLRIYLNKLSDKDVEHLKVLSERNAEIARLRAHLDRQGPGSERIN